MIYVLEWKLMREIGCDVFVDPQAEKVKLVGYALHGCGYGIWMPGTQKVEETGKNEYHYKKVK